MGGVNFLEEDPKRKKPVRSPGGVELTNPDDQRNPAPMKEGGLMGFLHRKHVMAGPRILHEQEITEEATPPAPAEPHPKLRSESGASLPHVMSVLNDRKKNVERVTQTTRRPLSAFPASSSAPREPANVSHPSELARDIFSSSRWSTAPESTGGGIDLNLVPGHEHEIATPEKRVRQLYWVVGILVIVVLLAWGVAFYLQQQTEQTVEDVTEEIVAMEQEIASLAPVAAREQVIADHTVAVSKVLDGQPYWSQFLVLLEDTVLPSVYWTSVTADPSGSVTLAGTAIQYNDMIDQVRVLEQYDGVKSVAIDKAETAQQVSSEGESLPSTPVTTFTLRLVFDASLIHLQASNE